MEERERGITVLHAPISTKVVILCVIGETAEITFGFRRYPYWHARIIDFNLKPGLYCICTCEHFAMTSISAVTSQNRTLFSTNKHLFPKKLLCSSKTNTCRPCSTFFKTTMHATSVPATKTNLRSRTATKNTERRNVSTKIFKSND